MCAQSCPTLCNPLDCSRPGSSVHGIFQARILEWGAIFFSRRSSPPRDRTRVSHVSCTGRQIIYHWATWEALFPHPLIFPMNPPEDSDASGMNSPPQQNISWAPTVCRRNIEEGGACDSAETHRGLTFSEATEHRAQLWPSSSGSSLCKSVNNPSLGLAYFTSGLTWLFCLAFLWSSTFSTFLKSKLSPFQRGHCLPTSF